MKNRAAGILAASILLGVSGTFGVSAFPGTCMTAFAAGHNPYADVPKSDWSYSAVERLISQGLVSGMTVEDYHNLKRLTRNDLAVYIAQAVSQRENANAHDRDLIFRLVKDYAYELHTIGVDDEYVPEPKKAKKADTRPNIYKQLDKFSFQGWGRIRYGQANTKGTLTSQGRALTHTTDHEVDIGFDFDYKLADNWSYHGSSEIWRSLNKESDTTEMNWKDMFLLGHMHGYDLRVGRFGPSNQLPYAFDESVAGVEVQWGSRWRSTLDIGHVAKGDSTSSSSTSSMESSNGVTYAGWQSLDYTTPRVNLPWYLEDWSFLGEIKNGTKVAYLESGTDGAQTLKIASSVPTGATEVTNIIQGAISDAATSDYVGIDVNGLYGDDPLYMKRSRPDVISYRVHGMLGHGTWGGLGVYHTTRGNVELYQDPQKPATYFGYFSSSRLTRKTNFMVQASYGKCEALPNRSVVGGGTYSRRFGWMARYQYGISALDKPKSWSVYALYQYAPRLSSYTGTTNDWWMNEKGWRVGGEYTFDKNMMLNYFAQWSHDIDTNGYRRYYRLQMNWMF